MFLQVTRKIGAGFNSSAYAWPQRRGGAKIGRNKWTGVIYHFWGLPSERWLEQKLVWFTL